MELEKANRRYRVGIIGAVVAAVCCFTPLLVILVTVVGWSALVGYLDYVLFPALGLFLLLAAVGWVQRRRCQRECE
ncbi:mercury resistance system transport protein MerF [Nitrospinae bacterium AH_259_B05_G02_I21]|nr:mercury resistance system transport protein MerF [Nitrospinae bacterium AH_259_B05_G02_I21]MDA2932532.1 mercury resistance system transport protein MerF [Nitrospinae bacterium AH-259-F20]